MKKYLLLFSLFVAPFFALSQHINLITIDQLNARIDNGKDTTYIINFWATWCGPCQFMLPIFDKLSKKYTDKVKFGRLNVDDNQSIAMRLEVYAIPTFVMFVGGNAVDRAVGAVGEKGLDSLLQKTQS